jgi:hypothetical protein
VGDHDHGRGVTRRGALATITVGIGAAIGGMIAVPVAGYVAAPAVDEETFHPAALGTVDEFAAERGFRPTAAPFVEDPAQPLTSRQLAYVHHTGGRSTDWLAADVLYPAVTYHQGG